MKKLVRGVKSSEYAILKSNPPQLVIYAVGETQTLHWTNGTLIPWIYIMPPKDGILDFDFYAEPPTGPNLQTLGAVTATITVEMPSWIKGYRIHSAAANGYEVKFGKQSELQKSDDPRNEKKYVVAGQGMNGIVGDTSTAKIATLKSLYLLVNELGDRNHIEKIKDLSRTDIFKVFDKKIIQQILATHHNGFTGGIYKFLEVNDNGNKNTIYWTNDNDIPVELIQFHNYLFYI